MWSYNSDLYLAHYGILGQKWGVRRYQNPDGTLTKAGKARYATLRTAQRTYDLWKGDKELKEKLKAKDGSAKALYKKYSKAERKEIKSVPTKKSDSVVKQMNRKLDIIKGEMHDVPYGSAEWFDIRDKYFSEKDRYAKKYVKAVLKDMTLKLRRKDLKRFSDWVDIANKKEKQRAFLDPVTGETDPNLTDPRNVEQRNAEL